MAFKGANLGSDIDMPVVHGTYGCSKETPCGAETCAFCVRRASVAVAGWVVAFQERRKNKAVGTTGEQRRYVHNQVKELRAMLGLGDEVDEVSEWARWMRARR